MSKMIGIDLGTTNSCVAVMEGDTPTVIVNANGERTTPSVVAFTKTGERLVGTPAKRQAVINTDRTISSIKRDMGSDRKIKIDGKTYKPQEISAFILQQLKSDAERFLGETVTDAVITVPAYFTDAQRQATKDAGTIAGLNVQRIINEPTAAALSYGVDKEEDRAVMVYDLGGGTFDVSVLSIESGFIKVLATAGDNHLGGDDFDMRLVDKVCTDFKNEHGVDLRRDPAAMQRLREACETAKKELSSAQNAEINLPFITSKDGNPLHLQASIARAEFERITSDLIDRTMGPARQALSDAGIAPNAIGKVLMVGGSSRMPCAQNAVKKLTGKEPSKNINPDEAVALGACLQSGVLSGTVKDIILMDVTPLSLGVELQGDLTSVLIPRNSAIPTTHSEMYTTATAFQTVAEINVLQGESPRASENKSLGKFRLHGIKNGLGISPQIQVTFEIDTNGIVHVTAKELRTGKSAQIEITGSSNMSFGEVERARLEAAKYADEDEKRNHEAEMNNRAQSLINEAERLAESMDHEGKKNINALVKDVEKDMKHHDIERLTDDCDKLESILDTIKSYLENQQE